MNKLDKSFRILSSHAKLTSEPENQVLDAFEIRLIAEGELEKITDFASSARLHSVDPKGDTPLHLAARTGNLALCDLFIRSGADPDAQNHEGQTPADVAYAEGENLISQLLYSLVTNSPELESFEARGETPILETTTGIIEAIPVTQRDIVKEMALDDVEDLLSFEAEEKAEDFFVEAARETASGTFVPLVSPRAVVTDDDGGDWNLDLSPASIAGEGIGTGTATKVDHGAELDFLKVRNRGRKSVKRAVVQTGTRLFIDPEICINWAEEFLAKGWYSFSDIESLVALCEGNGDLEELAINLRRNLEAAGYELIDATSGHDGELWDARSDISSDELAEAIETSLTRSTRLPGTQRFVMDKADELQLLQPMVRAKQEIQLGILASEAAVKTILDVVDNVRGGVRDPGSVSLRTINPSRPAHTETAEVIAAAEALKFWQANGRVMDGKRRKRALAALESIDLSLAFLKELVRSLEQSRANPEHINCLDAQISVFEATNEHLIHKHLPYARRFAARNVEEGEDPEDVFQVAFMGLQRSTRRFDPERGYPFVIYASYWMRQAIVRWRANKGAAIRIPVHRKEEIAKFDLAMEKLDIRADGAVSDNDLAAYLEWTTDEVSRFREIPRLAEYPESTDAWDDLLIEHEDANYFDQSENERIVADALSEIPEREADVIRMRFGIGRDADMTLEEIGQIYGVTRERIRQIEAKGIDRLSLPVRKRRLQEKLGK